MAKGAKMETKVCRNKSCRTEKPASEFHRKAMNPDGLAHWCKDCNNADRASRKRTDGSSARWAAKNPHYGTLRKIGLSIEETESKVGRAETCQVCGSDERVCLDHDHETGEPRGYLCYKCNLAVGLMADDPKRLKQAARYLEG